MKLPRTEPIENVVGYGEFLPEFRKSFMTEPFEQPLVAFHKRKLGRHSTALTNEHRLWVWIRPTWTVYVSDRAGVYFEVPERATAEQAWAAWREYLALMKE